MNLLQGVMPQLRLHVFHKKLLKAAETSRKDTDQLAVGFVARWQEANRSSAMSSLPLGYRRMTHELSSGSSSADLRLTVRERKRRLHHAFLKYLLEGHNRYPVGLCFANYSHC